MTRRARRAAASMILFAFGGHAAFAGGVRPATPAPQPATSGASAPTETDLAAEGTSEADLWVTIRLERVRAQRAAFEAGRLVERAVREELRGNDEAAQELYASAVELETDNERARLGLAATRDRLGLVTDRVSLLDRAEREARARRQEVMFRFNAALEAAGDAIAVGTPEAFAKARYQIEQARLALAAAPELFSADDLDALDTRIAERNLSLEAAARNRADATERARRRDHARRIKAARVHDIRLEL
jgi:hypothetical protein